jgi:predicted ATPase
MRTDFLNERHLLIIDEPESNLHPEWQLKYAEIIVKLSKYGIPLLITTHSPYIVQALRVFSKKEGIADKTKFYLADKVSESSEIVDVTDNLDKIFLKLSKPFEELVWD